MPTKQFALEEGGEKRVEVSWNGMWKNFQLKLDGQVVGAAETQAQLKEGVTALLPDGSKIVARLDTGYGRAGLKLFHDDKPLPGSGGDPKVRIKAATGVVYFIAALNLAIGVASLLFKVQLLENLGVGAIAFAVIFAVLGFFTMKRSRVALILAILLFTLDALYTLVDQVSAAGDGHPPNLGFIFVRVVLIITMVNGVRAMGDLRAKEQPVAG